MTPSYSGSSAPSGATGWSKGDIVTWIVLGVAAAVAYGGYFLARPPSFVRALVKTIFMGAATGALISAGAPFPEARPP